MGLPVALVTGASSGIGTGFARALAPRGQPLVLVARSRERLDALAAQLGGEERAIAWPLDLAAAGAADALADGLEARGLEVELLVNNAGVGVTGRFWEADPARLQEIVALNAGAVVALTRRLLPGMIARGRGRVLNVVSMSAFQPVPFLAVYGASKAFALSFTEALAGELAGTGVRAVALCPGLVRTGFQARAGTDRVRYDRSPAQSVEEVVAAGLAGLERGGPALIPGWRDRASVFAQRLLPRALVRRAAAELFRPR